MRIALSLLWIATTVMLAPSRASAQCHEWKSGFEGRDVDGPVNTVIGFDDGSGGGTDFYVAGSFRSAGGVPANNVARFDGTRWTALGDGIENPVYALAVYDAGFGPRLYAAGFASGIHRWDGGSWTLIPAPLNGFSFVHGMAVHDDGSGRGQELFLCGWWDEVGDDFSANVAAWNGTTWRGVGDGVVGGGLSYHANALVVYDDQLGGGPQLVMGGRFDEHSNIARWDGTSWNDLADGLGTTGPSGSTAYSLAVRGNALFAGGDFGNAGSVGALRIARWNGVSWSALGSGLNGIPYALTTFAAPSGGGIQLYAGGGFNDAGGVPAQSLARWSGTTWSAVGTGVGHAGGGNVRALGVFDDGSGPALGIGGDFTRAGSVQADDAARWNGTAYSSLGSGGAGLMGGVEDLCAFGGEMYACGRFDNASGVHVNGIARWTGTAWTPLGTGLSDSVYALIAHDDGSGAALYAGGTFQTAGGVVARWNGSAWSAVGVSPLLHWVNDFAIFDDGSGLKLYAAGKSQTTGGPSIYVWDGATWTALPSGLGASGFSQVHDLHVFDDGVGAPMLCAGGSFTSIDGTPANNVAMLTPLGWTSLGTGTNGFVSSLTTFDDGAGPALFVGGSFTTAGGSPAQSFAKWDGAWSSVATLSFSTDVHDLEVFDDGSGPVLVVGGRFATVDAVPVNNLARWDGSTWSAFGTGVETGGSIQSGKYPERGVVCLQSFDDGNGPALWIGGGFVAVDGTASTNVARWSPCGRAPGVGFCFGDGSLSTPCPCAPPNTVPSPSGGPDAGCANSFHPLGAKLAANGLVNPDTIVLRASDLTPAGFTQFFSGTAANASGIAFGDGVRCVAGALVRFGGQFASNGSARYPNFELGHLIPLHEVSAAGVGSGQTRWYQALYRNAAASFCSAGTTNFTSGYALVWN